MSTLIRYNSEDIVIDTKRISTSTWADNTNNLGTAFTSSMQADQTLPSSQGNFFIDVFNMHTGSISSSKEYSIAYGHRDGSGSLDFTNDEGSFGYSATRWNYSHYRQIVYGDELQEFNFNGFVPKDVWVINIERKNYKQNLKPGTLNLFLGESDSGALIQLTDNSVTTIGAATLTMCGRQYDIVSGSSGQAITAQKSNLSAPIGDEQHGSYGYFYPDAGFIVLNPAALAETLGGSGNAGSITNLTSNETANAPGFNIHKLLSSIQYGSYFICDSEEKVTSQYYFTRVKNQQYNFTTNPTFIDNDGNLRYTTMENNPKVFITTVGLYNDTDDLVAVAKLSQPIAKDFSKEALIRVKLDY